MDTSLPKLSRGLTRRDLLRADLAEPGGWNRIQLQVDDLAGEVETLRKAGAHFRNDIVVGRRQADSARRPGR